MQYITRYVGFLLYCVECFFKQTLLELQINLHPHIYKFRSTSRYHLHYRSTQSESNTSIAEAGDKCCYMSQSNHLRNTKMHFTQLRLFLSTYWKLKTNPGVVVHLMSTEQLDEMQKELKLAPTCVAPTPRRKKPCGGRVRLDIGIPGQLRLNAIILLLFCTFYNKLVLQMAQSKKSVSIPYADPFAHVKKLSASLA